MDPSPLNADGSAPPLLADAYAVGVHDSVASARATVRSFPLGQDRERLLLAVADGIGDPPSAEAQAAEVLTRLEASVSRSAEDAVARAILATGYVAAADGVARLLQMPGSVLGSGVALTAVLVENGVATIANVGNGAVLLVRAGRIWSLTGQQGRRAADEESGTAEAQGRGPLLGTRGPVTPTFSPSQPLQPGDTLVVCSGSVAQGLGGRVIRAVVEEYPPEAVPQELSNLAVQQMDAGGAAVALLRVPDAPAMATMPLPMVPPAAVLTDTPPPVRRRPWLVALVVGGAIALGALVVLAIVFAATRTGGPRAEAPTVATAQGGNALGLAPRSTSTPLFSRLATTTPAARRSPTPLAGGALPSCDTQATTPCEYTARPGDAVSSIATRFDISNDCFVASNRQHQPVAPVPPAFAIGVNQQYVIPNPSTCAALIAGTATPGPLATATGTPGPAATAVRTPAPSGTATAASSLNASPTRTPSTECTPRPGAAVAAPIC